MNYSNCCLIIHISASQARSALFPAVFPRPFPIFFVVRGAVCIIISFISIGFVPITAPS